MPVLAEHLYLEEAQLDHELTGGLGQDMHFATLEGRLQLHDVTERRDIYLPPCM
jgi:hypothetical protein